MADFAQFSSAAEDALGIEPGGFLRALKDNKIDRHEIALEASPVAIAIRGLIERRGGWEGTASDLLKELEFLVDEGARKSKQFPSDATRLSKLLARLAPDLRGVGIELSRGEGRDRRKIKLELISGGGSSEPEEQPEPDPIEPKIPQPTRSPSPVPANMLEGAIAVGSRVRKKFYNGWVGEVRRLERSHAEILWFGDTQTSLVRLVELELDREVRRGA